MGVPQCQSPHFALRVMPPLDEAVLALILGILVAGPKGVADATFIK